MGKLADFYYDFNYNFYYDRLANGLPSNNPFSRLRDDAYYHFSTSIPEGAMGQYNKAIQNIRKTASIERAKENQVLNKYYVKEGSLDISELSESQIIKLFTDAMSIRGMWEFTMDAVLNNKKLLRNDMAKIEKHMVRNIFPKKMNEHLQDFLEIGNEHLGKKSFNENAFRKDIEKLLQQVVDESTEKMIDDAVKFGKEHKDLYGDLSQLKKSKKEYQDLYNRWKNELGVALFTSIALPTEIGQYIKKAENGGIDVDRASEQFVKSIVSKVTIAKNASRIGGFMNEVTNNVTAKLNSLITEALSDLQIGTVTLDNSKTVDNVRVMGFGKETIGTIGEIKANFSDYQVFSEDKIKAREQSEESLNKIETLLKGQEEIAKNIFLVKENSKMYEMTNGFGYHGGTYTIGSDLNKLVNYGDADRLFALIVNAAEGGLMHGSEAMTSLMSSLAENVGKMLFDDYGYIGQNVSTTKVIHILNLNKNIIPLSTFLYATADAYEEAMQGQEVSMRDNVFKLGDTMTMTVDYGSKMDTSIQGGEEYWKSQAELARKSVQLKIDFFNNFTKRIAKWANA